MQIEGYSMAQLTVLKDMSVRFAMGTLLPGMYRMQGNTGASVASSMLTAPSRRHLKERKRSTS